MQIYENVIRKLYRCFTGQAKSHGFCNFHQKNMFTNQKPFWLAETKFLHHAYMNWKFGTHLFKKITLFLQNLKNYKLESFAYQVYNVCPKLCSQLYSENLTCATSDHRAHKGMHVRIYSPTSRGIMMVIMMIRIPFARIQRDTRVKSRRFGRAM